MRIPGEVPRQSGMVSPAPPRALSGRAATRVAAPKPETLAPVYSWFNEGFDTSTSRKRRRCSTSWREPVFRVTGSLARMTASSLSRPVSSPALITACRCPFRFG